MKYHKLVLSITFIAILLVQANAQPFMLMDVQSLGLQEIRGAVHSNCLLIVYI